MKLFEVLKYIGINVEGYGDDFIILNQKDYSIIRRNVAGLVTMKVITRKNKKYSYLLKYDIQNERKIIKRFINMEIICNLLSRNYWDNVEFDKENNVFYITAANAKLKLQHCLKNLVDIEYCEDKVAWALKIYDDNIESVFEVLRNEDILNDKLVKKRGIVRLTFYTVASLILSYILPCRGFTLTGIKSSLLCVASLLAFGLIIFVMDYISFLWDMKSLIFKRTNTITK